MSVRSRAPGSVCGRRKVGMRRSAVPEPSSSSAASVADVSGCPPRTPAIPAPRWTPPFRGKGFFRALGDIFGNAHSWLYYLHSGILNPVLAVMFSALTIIPALIEGSGPFMDGVLLEFDRRGGFRFWGMKRRIHIHRPAPRQLVSFSIGEFCQGRAAFAKAAQIECQRVDTRGCELLGDGLPRLARASVLVQQQHTRAGLPFSKKRRLEHHAIRRLQFDGACLAVCFLCIRDS